MVTVDQTTELEIHGVDAVTRFLDREQAHYEVIEHTGTFAAVDEATAAGSEAAEMAKTVLLRDHGGFRAVVIPASKRLDLHKARERFGASGHLRLASEAEIEQEFSTFDPGALPPFGSLLGIPEIFDTRLLGHERVLCSGGDHRHTLKISPREIQRLGEPFVGDVCVGRPSHPLRPPANQPKGDEMPATTKPAPRPRTTAKARARAEDNERRLEHVMESLEAAQKDLGSIGGSLGTGVRDLRRDVNRLLRDARRDVLKMRRAVQRDLERLQKDLSAAATAKPAPARRRPATSTRTATRRTTASEH
jgi:Ala-tRNA(Pro) deacylase